MLLAMLLAFKCGFKYWPSPSDVAGYTGSNDDNQMLSWFEMLLYSWFSLPTFLSTADTVSALGATWTLAEIIEVTIISIVVLSRLFVCFCSRRVSGGASDITESHDVRVVNRGFLPPGRPRQHRL